MSADKKAVGFQPHVQCYRNDNRSLAHTPPGALVVPTVFTRGPLFEAVRKAKREWYVRREIPSLHGGKLAMVYTGQQLDSNDQIAWLACVRLCRHESIGREVHTSVAAILRECGLGNTGPNQKAMRERLWRLSKASLDISTDKYKLLMTGLLDVGFRDDNTIIIRLREGSAELYQDLAFASWEEVKQLKHHEASIRLMTFAIGHEIGRKQRHSLENMRRFLGYREMRMDRFRRLLQQAGMELEDTGFLRNFSIRNELATNRAIVSWVRERQYESYR